MNNIGLAIQILLELISGATSVIQEIQVANATGQDITPEQLQDIIQQRNAVLDELKQIAAQAK
jgi:uncharacterized protein YnzC (UPF0291/DUF896 family)